MKPVFSVSNADVGITADVYKGSKGYSVTLRDDDAGERLQFVKIFPDLEDAKRYAEKIVN